MGMSVEVPRPHNFFTDQAKRQLVELLSQNRHVSRRNLYTLAHQIMVELAQNMRFTPPGANSRWTLHPESGVANSSPLFMAHCNLVYEALGVHYHQLAGGDLKTIVTEIETNFPQSEFLESSLK